MADIQPRLPGASSLVGAAARVVEWEIRTARYMLSIPARIALLLDEADMIVARINSVIDHAERTVAAVDQIILSAARAVDDVDQTLGRVSVTLTRAEAAVESAEQVVTRVEAAVGEAEPIVGRVDATVGSADALVARVDTTVGAAEGLVRRVDSTVDRADGIIDRADGITGRADGVAGSAEAIVERAVPVVDFVESTVAEVRPVLEALLLEEGVRAEQARIVSTRVAELLGAADEVARKLTPLAGRVADTVSSEDFEAVLEVVDNLPENVRAVERDVLPVVRSLDTVAPEVHQILEVAQDCLEALNGIPGFQRLRRRGGSNGGRA